ncbi:MAG: hypothetical protein ACOYOE_11040 [Chlorobium sp.]
MKKLPVGKQMFSEIINENYYSSVYNFQKRMAEDWKNTSLKNLKCRRKQLREAGQIERIGSSKTGGYYPKQ